MGAKKSKPPEATASGIKKAEVSPPLLKFSFRFFDETDSEVCPSTFPSGYVQALMDRLRSLSSWTITDFVNPRGKSLRNHPIDWPDTARPNGFRHLNKQLKAYPAYQFSISQTKWGRVHGLLIDDTFHVIWLDHDHVVYS